MEKPYRFQPWGKMEARGGQTSGRRTIMGAKCIEDDLQVMVQRFFLQSKVGIWWRSALGDVSPSPEDSEIVLFTSFLEHGLSLPASDFLQDLQYYYGIQIHHLTPQSVLHIAMFVHFCKTFLGIEPHFEFFWSLYTLTPLPFAEAMDSIGCANLELRLGMVEKYLEWHAIHVDPEWKGSRFYTSNPAPVVPMFSAGPPVYIREWILKYNTGFRDQVEELLERTVCFQ